MNQVMSKRSMRLRLNFQLGDQIHIDDTGRPIRIVNNDNAAIWMLRNEISMRNIIALTIRKLDREGKE